jgi:hypothetical protein
LNSTVSTPASAGIREKAAYPQALSRAVATIPAWTKVTLLMQVSKS